MTIIPGSFWPRISAPWVDSPIAQQIDPIKVTTARGKQRPFDLTQEKAEWLPEFQGSGNPWSISSSRAGCQKKYYFSLKRAHQENNRSEVPECRGGGKKLPECLVIS